MRKGILLLSLLVLASLLQAQLNVTEFVTPYLYRGENYSRDVRVVDAKVSSGNYSIVIINNTYTFLLNMSDRIYPVENQASINSVLRQYYTTATYPTHAELDSLNSSSQSFLASRGSEEAECLVVTGLENPDRSPRLTCTAGNICESCQAVPVCRDVMKGTQETPDPMSSSLVKAIVVMSVNFQLIRANLSVFNTEMANIGNSTDVSVSLTAMQQSLTSVKSLLEGLGKSPVSIIYEQYTDYHNPKALGFCKNFYKLYNLTALSSAISQATQLSSRVPTEGTLDGWVSSIFNNTPTRKLNRTIREDRDKFDAAYAVLLDRRNSIVQRANQSLLYIHDNSTIKQLSSLDDILSQIAELGDKRDYDNASRLSKNFSLMADIADSQVSGLETTYNQLLANNESASDALFKAGLYLEPQDFVLNDELELLRTQKASVDFTIYNSSPFSLSQANQLSDQLLNIQLSASAIVGEKSGATSNQMNSLLSIIAKPVVSFSLGVINSVIPLSYADKEKNTSTIIAVILVAMDLFILLFTFGAFFFFVRSKRIELHKVAKIAWAFIFVFFIVLLALSTLAIYNVADLQSHPTNFGPFLSELKSSSKAGVVVELTDLNATMKEKMVNCSERIVSKLASLNKSVMDFRYDGDNCFAGNLTQSKSSCENDIDANPVMILRSGGEDKATFMVFYTKKATFEGGEKFFEDCLISKALD
ncbi:MAG: hypothetical protein NTY73_01275 [Candidatus Micrarchaeota archaeon]|nr:hypothetical protein [Candidatus Micrarchaeota archaeon]